MAEKFNHRPRLPKTRTTDGRVFRCTADASSRRCFLKKTKEQKTYYKHRTVVVNSVLNVATTSCITMQGSNAEFNLFIDIFKQEIVEYVILYVL